MKDQWQDNLRNRMEDHEEPAPEGLWDDVERIMRAESAVDTLHAGQRIRLWSRRVGAVAAVALVLFFIGLFTLKENQKIIRPVPIVHSTKKEEPAKVEELLFAHKTEKRTPEPEVLPHRSGATEHEESEQVGQGEESEQQPEEVRPSEEPGSRHPHPDTDQDPSSGINNEPAFHLPAHRRNQAPAKWQTDIYASNIPSGSAKHYDGYRIFTPYDFPSEVGEHFRAAGPDLPGDILMRAAYQHVYTDIKHFQPITFGASLKYNFNEEWSITSGLNYTLLSSQLRSGDYSHYYNSQQTLHYLGIPVNLNYTVWRGDKVSMYISGGGVVEKNMKGTLLTDYVIDNKIVERSRDRISVKPLQWSVNSAVGVQYQLSKPIGLYAEPGVAYHFKNGSEVETIYREKPLNFSIRLGLRFSLND